MLIVRFPNGQAIQYNDANFLSCHQGTWVLYSNESKEKWIASIQESAGAIVEAVRACDVWDATRRNQDQIIKSELVLIQKRISKVERRLPLPKKKVRK